MTKVQIDPKRSITPTPPPPLATPHTVTTDGHEPEAFVTQQPHYGNLIKGTLTLYEPEAFVTQQPSVCDTTLPPQKCHPHPNPHPNPHTRNQGL